MWNKPTTSELSKKLPKIYANENTPLRDTVIHMHFFIGGCDWYIAEFDGDDMLWGFAILNEDYQMAEWGYCSYKEFRELKVGVTEVDNDLHWQPRPAGEIDKIKKCLNAF